MNKFKSFNLDERFETTQIIFLIFAAMALVFMCVFGTIAYTHPFGDTVTAEITAANDLTVTVAYTDPTDGHSKAVKVRENGTDSIPYNINPADYKIGDKVDIRVPYAKWIPVRIIDKQ